MFFALGLINKSDLHRSVLLLPGLGAGVVWAMGNCVYVLAQVHINFATATSVWQTALFMSGMWGVLAFKELRRSIDIFFFVCALAL